MLVSKKLPFYWRAVKNNDENRIAKFLDFSFTYSKKYNYIHQKISNKLKSQLSLMYKLNANIGHSHANNSFNLPYTKELIRFIISNSKKR